MNTFALRDWRVVRGLTISQLSAAVPMPQPQLSKIQAGLEQPSVARLCRMAEVLGISPESLIGPADLSSAVAEWPFVRGKKRRMMP